MNHVCHRNAFSWGLLGAIAAIFGLSGCRGDETDSARRGLSTTALRANRAPVPVVGETQDANEPDTGAGHAGKRFGGDAGVLPAAPLKGREQLNNDALATRDTVGVLLDAEWRWSDVPGPSNAPEISVDALEALRTSTRLRMRVDVAAAGRISIAFVGHGYPWPDGTELRARVDRLGHVLVWPDGKHYRNVVTGALRALFSDQRLDRGHLFTPKTAVLAPGSVLGQATTRQSLSTPMGELQLEQATLPSAGDGAPLLCRFLVELMGIDPDTSACSPDQLVLHANLASAPGGKLQFVVNQLSRKQDLPLSVVQVPPDGATFVTSGVPTPVAGSVPRKLLEALRNRATLATAPAKDAPNQGLLAINRTLALRALLIDGVVVAWLPSRAELGLTELKSGSYSVAWRDFFGTFVEPPRIITLPAKVVLGKLPETGG